MVWNKEKSKSYFFTENIYFQSNRLNIITFKKYQKKKYKLTYHFEH